MKKGFTIIELVISAAILLAVISLIMTALTRVNRLNAEAKEQRHIMELSRALLDRIEDDVSNVISSNIFLDEESLSLRLSRTLGQSLGIKAGESWTNIPCKEIEYISANNGTERHATGKEILTEVISSESEMEDFFVTQDGFLNVTNAKIADTHVYIPSANKGDIISIPITVNRKRSVAKKLSTCVADIKIRHSEYSTETNILTSSLVFTNKADIYASERFALPAFATWREPASTNRSRSATFCYTEPERPFELTLPVFTNAPSGKFSDEIKMQDELLGKAYYQFDDDYTLPSEAVTIRSAQFSFCAPTPSGDSEKHVRDAVFDFSVLLSNVSPAYVGLSQVNFTNKFEPRTHDGSTLPLTLRQFETFSPSTTGGYSVHQTSRAESPLVAPAIDNVDSRFVIDSKMTLLADGMVLTLSETASYFSETAYTLSIPVPAEIFPIGTYSYSGEYEDSPPHDEYTQTTRWENILVSEDFSGKTTDSRSIALDKDKLAGRTMTAQKRKIEEFRSSPPHENATTRKDVFFDAQLRFEILSFIDEPLSEPSYINLMLVNQNERLVKKTAPVCVDLYLKIAPVNPNGITTRRYWQFRRRIPLKTHNLWSPP